MFFGKKLPLSPSEAVARKQEHVEGVGAETLLGVLGPVMEKRLKSLVVQLIQQPPDYDNMLNLRAQITEVYRIQSELESVKSRGKEAGEALGNIFNPQED